MKVKTILSLITLALMINSCAQVSGGPSNTGLGTIILLAVLLIVFILQLFYILTLRKVLFRCAPERRTLRPNMVWFTIVPVFGSIWHFFVVSNVAKSLHNEYVFKNIDLKEKNPGKTIGIIMCILLLLSFCYFIIPVVGALIPILGIVFLIIYWHKIKLLSDNLLHQEETSAKPYSFMAEETMIGDNTNSKKNIENDDILFIPRKRFQFRDGTTYTEDENGYVQLVGKIKTIERQKTVKKDIIQLYNETQRYGSSKPESSGFSEQLIETKKDFIRVDIFDPNDKFEGSCWVDVGDFNVGLNENDLVEVHGRWYNFGGCYYISESKIRNITNEI